MTTDAALAAIREQNPSPAPSPIVNPNQPAATASPAPAAADSALCADVDAILTAAESPEQPVTVALKRRGVGLPRLKRLAGKHGLKVKGAAGMKLDLLISF
jgi:hypothetical protein